MTEDISQDTIDSVLRTFGITKIDQQKKLPGYYDLNFYIESNNKKYVLKASTVGTKDTLDLQNKAMKHVAEKSLVAPYVYSTIDGQEIVEKNDMFFRLLSFIPGIMMNEIQPSDNLLENSGRLLAKTDLALQDFSHPFEHGEYIWDIQHAKKLKDYLKYLKDTDHKELAQRALEEFEKISENLSKCRHGVTHNDGHVFNIVVNDEKTRVVALIDYGDMVHSYYICNLAVSVAGLLTTESGSLDKASYIIKGYNDIFPLTPEEKSVLKVLISTRLAMLGILAAHALLEDPNNTYVVGTAAQAWERLPIISDMSEEGFSKYLPN